jgi:hypothetical protein
MRLEPTTSALTSGDIMVEKIPRAARDEKEFWEPISN